MDERVDSLDLEWFRPPASELMGLRIASDEEFRRCEVVLGEHLEIFRWVNKWDRFVVVRKTDLHLFHEAGLICTEVELSEPSQDKTEEQRAETRAAMRRYMDLWLKELGWRKDQAAFQPTGSPAMNVCGHCIAPVRQAWASYGRLPPLAQVAKRGWDILLKCPQCGALWYERDLDRGGQYLVVWPFSLEQWEQLEEGDHYQTLLAWHTNRVRDAFATLSGAERQFAAPEYQVPSGGPSGNGPDLESLLEPAKQLLIDDCGDPGDLWIKKGLWMQKGAGRHRT